MSATFATPTNVIFGLVARMTTENAVHVAFIHGAKR